MRIARIAIAVAALATQMVVVIPHADAVTCGRISDDYIYFRTNGSSYGTKAAIRFTHRSLSSCPDPIGGLMYTGSGVVLQPKPGDTSKMIEFGWHLDAGAYSCSPVACWQYFWSWEDGANSDFGSGPLTQFSCASSGNYGQFAIVSKGNGSYDLKFRCSGANWTLLKTINNRSFSQGVSEVETFRYENSGASDDQKSIQYRTSTSSNFTDVTSSLTCVSDSIVGWDGTGYFSSSTGYGYNTYSVSGDTPYC